LAVGIRGLGWLRMAFCPRLLLVGCGHAALGRD
jgi:hypothetical protein